MIVGNSSYQPKFLHFNKHIETIAPALFRRVKGVKYERERINTVDGDFLDLDWVKLKSKKLLIISHGLEGASDRPYVKGMAKAFHQNGYEIIAWNYRGCSGEMNQKLRFYHSGATDDLQQVIDHALSMNKYDTIHLIGFSLGGNLTLKYLGESAGQISKKIKKAVVFSVPLHLHTSCLEISKPSNFIYSERFLVKLKKKIKQKAMMMPDQLDATHINRIDTLMAFDNQYTAPIHGFQNALDYYGKCSSIGFIDSIKIPTLIVNAQNDPFLSGECYPYSQIKKHDYVHLETPKKGGHCGFSGKGGNGTYWSEQRALAFIYK